MPPSVFALPRGAPRGAGCEAHPRVPLRVVPGQTLQWGWWCWAAGSARAIASDGGVGVGAAGGESMMSTLTPCFNFDLQHH
jgi:hypothetical protein